MSYFILWSTLALYSLLPSPLTYTPPKSNIALKHTQNWMDNRLRTIDDPALKKLATSYFLGGQFKMPTQLKDAHQILGMSHLFSPSGLHLSSLLLLLFPLRLMGKSSKRTRFALKNIALTAVLFLPNYYALKRMAVYKMISGPIHRIWPGVNGLQVFFLVFFGDFIFGTFAHSPLSFLLSYLFLGTLMSNFQRPLIVQAWHMALAQILGQALLSRPYYILSLPFNAILTGIFSLIYPLMTLLLAWGGHKAIHLLEGILSTYAQLLIHSAQWVKTFGYCDLNLWAFAIFLGRFLVKSFRGRKIYSFCALLSYSLNLF